MDTSIPYRSLCTIVWEVAKVEFQLEPPQKCIERESQAYWFEVYNGERLPRVGTRRRLSPRQHFMRKLMSSLTEIDRTFRLMQHLELYAAKPPRLNGEATTLDFLGYL